MDFINDEEKIQDYFKLTKDEFLESYSYLTEEDYNATTKALEKGLRITKVYRTSNDEIASKIAFYGYDKEKKSKQYPNGVPIPLIALAREYGTSSGEKKKPFFRKSFKKKEIEDAMLKIQEKYLPKE